MKHLMLVLFTGLISLSSACYSIDAKPNASEFWSDFRQAIIENDHEAVADMTRFPFETRGTGDWMPVHEYDRAAFMRILPKLLEQPVAPETRRGFEEASMRSLIEDTENLSPKHILSDSQVRVGDFEMTNTNDGWRFTFAYWDGESAAE